MSDTKCRRPRSGQGLDGDAPTFSSFGPSIPLRVRFIPLQYLIIIFFLTKNPFPVFLEVFTLAVACRFGLQKSLPKKASYRWKGQLGTQLCSSVIRLMRSTYSWIEGTPTISGARLN